MEAVGQEGFHQHHVWSFSVGTPYGLVPIAGSRDDINLGLGIEEGLQRRTDQRIWIGQNDSYRRRAAQT